MNNRKTCKLDVAALVDKFNGITGLQNKLSENGYKVHTGTISVWLHRGSIPSTAIIVLMLSDRKFDPRKYGWSAT